VLGANKEKSNAFGARCSLRNKTESSQGNQGGIASHRESTGAKVALFPSEPAVQGTGSEGDGGCRVDRAKGAWNETSS